MSPTAPRTHLSTESTLSCRETDLPDLATDIRRVQRFIASLPRTPGRADVPALVLASRALLILGRDRQARYHLDRALEIGGLPALALGTLALPREGPALGFLRLARPDSPETHAKAHCDLAVIALRHADLDRARSHIEAARSLAPELREPLHWKRLLANHAESLLGWLTGQDARFSPLAARRLLDCWPDATNGYLAPIRLRGHSWSAETPRESPGACVMKKVPSPPSTPPSSSWPEKSKPLAGSSAC